MDSEGEEIFLSDSSDSHYSLSDLSDPQCRLHRLRELVRDEDRAEVLVSELVLDVLRCKECLVIQRALEFVRPGFIAESEAGNGTVEVVKIHPNTHGDEHLVEITFRRCPQAEYQPKDEEYLGLPKPRYTLDVTCQFQMLRKSPISPLYEHYGRFMQVGQFGQALEIVQDSSTEEAFARASQWLSHCVENDEACRPPDDDYMPHRLIDVGSKSQAPRLCESPDGLPHEPYACLSYCWGIKAGDEVLKTKTTNLSDFKIEILIGSAPPAIQDAVNLCRGLDIKYLWVDSLCLVQDDQKIWLREAAEMDRIYLNSHLTIAVMEPYTCKLPFLGRQKFADQSWQYLVKTDIPVYDGGPQLELLIRPGCNNAKDAATLTTLDTRAWCLQESLLPNRRLCFDGNEMIWECLCIKLCECGHTTRRPPVLRYSVLGAGIKKKRLRGHPHQRGPYPILAAYEMNQLGDVSDREPSDADTSREPGSAAHDSKQLQYERVTKKPRKMNIKWRRLISDYSTRGITNEEDKLRAISGLAKIVLDWFQKDRSIAAPVEYLAGLWKHDFHLDLAWMVTSLPPKREQFPSEATWNVPTWSWASTRGPVEFPGERASWIWKYSPEMTDECRIEKVECVREYQEDETSAVTRGSAELRGALTAVELDSEVDPNRLGKSGYRAEVLGYQRKTIWDSLDLRDFDEGPVEALERMRLVRSKHQAKIAVLLDEPLSNPPRREGTRKSAPADTYYCFRLFAWFAYTRKPGMGNERAAMGPETWFLLLRSSERVHGAMERIGIGLHMSEHKYGMNPCPIFKDANEKIIKIV